jgi:hypothetical protein
MSNVIQFPPQPDCWFDLAGLADATDHMKPEQFGAYFRGLAERVKARQELEPWEREFVRYDDPYAEGAA